MSSGRTKAWNRRRDAIAKTIGISAEQDERAIDDALALAREFHPDDPFGVQGFDRINILAGMHKARLHINSFTDEEKTISRKWLTENNFSHDC